MKTSNNIIKASGDIGFYWGKQHPSFFWGPGDYTMLNQKFIDDYQLLQLGYGRILSRGKNYIKVEFLRSYPKLHYEKGKIVSLQPNVISENCLVSQSYIRLIPEELPPVKEVAEKDKVNVRMLKPGGNRAEATGSIFRISIDEASRLLEGHFIEVLPDDYTEPITKIPVYKDADFLSVKCIRSHPDYADLPGRVGKILKTALPKLLSEGYFDLEASGKERAKILVELGIQLDPYTKKLITK